MANAVQKVRNTIKYWWMYLVIGIFLLIGGIYVFMTPLASYLSLVIIFAVLMLFDGIGTIIASVSNSKEMKGWGWHLAAGIITTIIGIGLIAYPGVTVVILPIYIGFWVLIKGSMLIGASFDMKSNDLDSWWMVLLLGILISIFAFLMILNPLVGVSAVVGMTAATLIVTGLGVIILSLKLHGVKSKAEELKEKVQERLSGA